MVGSELLWLNILSIGSILLRDLPLLKKNFSSSGKNGIEPYLINLSPEIKAPETVTNFWNADILVLNIPPGRARDNVIKYHPQQIDAVAKAAAAGTIKRIVFVSSTSVYPEKPGTVTEKDATPGKAVRDSGNALLIAEDLLMSSPAFKTTILRFGGLYGGDRHPAKYMAGRESLGKAHAPVNLIHRDDCIQIITQIIEEDINDEIFNAVADAHPTRKEYYTRAAEKLNLDPPSFEKDSSNKNYKVVSNAKLKEQLSYRFIHPQLGLA